METPEIGDKVRVRSVVACDGEGVSHGYNPYVKGLVGVILPRLFHVGPPEGHPWRVVFLGDDAPRLWQYFAASELELLEG